MTQPTQNVQVQTLPSVSSQIIHEISTDLAWIVDKTVTTPFLFLKDLATLLAKPAMYGATALTIIHIAVRPGQSKEIASNLLHATPGAVEGFVASIPSATQTAYKLSQRVCHTAFKVVGNKVGVPEAQQTVVAVVKGLVTHTPQFARNAYPITVSALDNLLTQTEKGLNKVGHLVTDSVIPSVVNKFNTTFPA